MPKTRHSNNLIHLLKRGSAILLGASRKHITSLVILNVIGGLIDPINAIIYQNLLDCISDSLKKGSLQYICFILIALLALASVAAFILSGMVELVKRNYVDIIDLYVSEHVLEKSISLPMETFDNAKIYNHINAAISQTSSSCVRLLETVSEIIYVVVKGTSFLYIIWRFNWKIALISFLSMSPLLFLSVKINKYWYDIYKNRIEKTRLIHYLKLLMVKNSNIKEIKLFDVGEKIVTIIKENYTNFIKEDALARKTFLGKRSVHHIFSCIFEFGVKLWLVLSSIQEKCSLGTIVLYMNSLDSLKSAYAQFIRQLSLLQNSLQYLEALDILEHEDCENDTVGKPFDSCFRSIEFRNVSFRYPGCSQYVLKDINLRFDRGKTYFIVGFNGSGKTTLIKLLLRLYPPSEGEILIDGINLQDLDVKQYYANIGAIFQDFVRYPFDIWDNVLVKTDKEDLQLFSTVINQVGMYKFVSELPEREHTLLMRDWSSGIDLSQGQWQRLAIARCIYRNGVISILDEPFSSLDAEGENSIISNLRKQSCDKLTIFITHRFSSISRSDRIVVLKEGVIVEQGTHEELIRNKNIYYRLYSSQNMVK